MAGSAEGRRPVLGCVGEGLVELTIDPERAEARMAFGGDVANVAVMASRAGARARLCGRVGDDGPGRALLGFWRGEALDVAHVAVDAGGATGLYLNEPADDGHRFVYWRAGSAGSRLDAADVTPAFLDGLDMLVVSGISLSISASARRACEAAAAAVRDAGRPVAFVLNHRPALAPDPAVLAAFAMEADVVVGSREDAERVFGTDDLAALGRRLAGGPEEIVLTGDRRPAELLWRGAEHHVPVPAVAVRNAAGAGDALAGTYLASRLLGRPAPDCLARGVAAASFSVQRDGCAQSYPTPDELSALVPDVPVAR